MTVASIGFKLVLMSSMEDNVRMKVGAVHLTDEEAESALGEVGKQYMLEDIISGKFFVLDMTRATVEGSELVFAGDKPNFYRIPE